MTLRGPSLPEKIIVTLPPDFKTLVPGYLENRRRDLERLEAALEKGNHATIQSLGHNMKGSGTIYGFQAVTDIGLNLERAAKEGNLPKMEQGITALEHFLRDVEVVYGSAEEGSYNECG